MSEWLKQPWIQEVWKSTYPHLPGLAAALGILIGGWILAWIIHKVIFAALTRTTVDDKLAELLGIEIKEDEHRIERIISRTFYYVMLAFVFVAFFDRLKIDAVTKPVLTALDGLTAAVPNLLKAVVIGFVGFVAATLVRKLILLVLDKTGLVAKMEKLTGDDAKPAAPTTEKKTDKKKKKKKRDLAEAPLATTVADVAYWFIIVVTAIPVLEALKIGALASPLSNALATVTVYLPRIVAALVLLVVGYVLARIVRSVVAGVFDKVGIDRAVGRLGFAKVMRGQSLGRILGTIAMAFVLLNFAISAVGRLDIKEISVPLGLMLEQVYGFLPKLLVGAVLMAIAVVIARIAGNVVARLLAAMGFNSLMAHIGVFKQSVESRKQEDESKKLVEQRRRGESEEAEGDEADDLLAESGSEGLNTPSDVAGVVVAAIIVLLFLKQALGTMGLEGLAAMLGTLIGFLPNVLVAAVLLGAGMWAGSWAHRRVDELTKSADDRLLKALGSVAHVGIVAFAAMMAAQQLGVGRQLIGIAFALVLGAICLALALAFGLGGREVAHKILQKEYDRRQRRGGTGTGSSF